MKREIKGFRLFLISVLLICGCVAGLTGCGQKDKDTIVLRVSNWGSTLTRESGKRMRSSNWKTAV